MHVPSADADDEMVLSRSSSHEERDGIGGYDVPDQWLDEKQTFLVRGIQSLSDMDDKVTNMSFSGQKLVEEGFDPQKRLDWLNDVIGKVGLIYKNASAFFVNDQDAKMLSLLPGFVLSLHHSIDCFLDFFDEKPRNREMVADYEWNDGLTSLPSWNRYAPRLHQIRSRAAELDKKVSKLRDVLHEEISVWKRQEVLKKRMEIGQQKTQESKLDEDSNKCCCACWYACWEGVMSCFFPTDSKQDKKVDGIPRHVYDMVARHDERGF